MKIVIDIPDEDYNVILANADFYKEQHWGVAAVWDAIVSGVTLPKGHGDLIDRNVVYSEFDKADLSRKELIGKMIVFGVPTVIPADK